MSGFVDRLRAGRTSRLLLVALALGGTLPTAALAQGPTMERLSDERSSTAWAYVETPGPVRAEPSLLARAVGRVSSHTFTGSSDIVLVLGRSTEDAGAWSFVRYPGLGARTGWMPTAALSEVQTVSTRLVIDRRARRVRLYRGGSPIFSARVGIGARGSPTPGGASYVRERIVLRRRGGIYGVLAFGISAYSRQRTDWPGGGQVGIHGTNQPELIPGRISNGCVRLRNADIRRLGRLMPVGTPISIE